MSVPDPEPPTRRVLAPVYAAGFVTAFGAHAVAANLGGYGTRHHTSLWELGLLLGIYDGAEVVLKPVFGALSDRVGARPVLVGGLIGFALTSAAFVFAGSPHLLGVARLGQGASAAAFSPAAGAMVAALGGKKRTGRIFGGYGGAKGIGYLAGPLVGGALVATGGYSLLFLVLAVLAGAVAVLAARVVPRLAPTRKPRSTIIALARQVTHPTFAQPVLVLAVGTAALSAGVGYLPVLGARHHLGPFATGALVSLLAATAAVIQPWAGRAHDRSALPSAAGPMALLMAAAGFLVAVLAPNPPGIAIAAILIGAGIAVSTPLGFAGLAAAAPEGRMGQTMGAGEVGRELGDAGGPILVGALSPIGLGVGLLALAAAIGIGAGASWQLTRTTPGTERKAPDHPPPNQTGEPS
ncbi:MAG: MFS transporter [Actinomycetota bacterium]|nr:MFS transporter [Actinomycetota bacterium]